MSDGRLAPRVVWKFPVARGVTTITTPVVGPIPRHFGPDATGGLCVWVEHDYPAPAGRGVSMELTVVGTGYPIPEGGRYVGTAVIVEYGLVLHLYNGGRTS